ncbi:hypothetical protein ALC62_14860, partial [Cyphomyrmex costatus]
RFYDPWIILDRPNDFLRHLKWFSLRDHDIVTVLPTEEHTVSKIEIRQSLNVAFSLTKLTSRCHRLSANYLIIWREFLWNIKCKIMSTGICAICIKLPCSLEESLRGIVRLLGMLSTKDLGTMLDSTIASGSLASS